MSFRAVIRAYKIAVSSLCHAGCVAVHFAVLAHCGERKHAMEFSSVDLELASVVAFERDATGLAGSPDGGLRDGARNAGFSRGHQLFEDPTGSKVPSSQRI